MAEAEKDDWLDDLDSPEEQASELDQSDIDALLAGPGGEATPELDQSDIDALLSGSANPVTPAVASGPGGEATPELDQSDIDALLAGSDDFGTPAAASGPGKTLAPELDQTDIDALLAGTGDGGTGGMDSGDLDQSDIDALLAGPQSTGRGQGISDPDQDEIDKLFADVDNGSSLEETLFPAEEIDFKDVFNTSETATQSGLPNFDAEEFKLDADIPDIPDLQETRGFDLEETALFAETTVASPPPASPPPPQNAPGPVKPPPVKVPPPTGKRWNFVANRKVLYGAGAGVATLLLVAGVFFFKGDPKTPPPETPPAVVEHQPAAEHQQPPQEEHAEPSPAQPVAHGENGAPTVKDLDLIMPPESNQLAISLCGLDPNNEPLEYEFQSMPEHGQLTGHAPYLVYVPTPDYSGPDGFTVRATDGKHYSAPASIKIMRQPPLPAKEVPAPTVAAEPLAPATATARKRSVPVLQGGRSTRCKTATVAAKKNRAPVLVVQPVSSLYAPGATVVLNAGQTKDDHGDSVTFHWEQLAGVPVKINPSSAHISFVAPSFFNTVDPRLVFQVTATDQQGAQDRQEVSVTIRSQRTSAVWGLHE